MNRFVKKIGSRRGASMIIAIVFMLICLFVGGTVLVAATMNTHRMEHAPQNQVFLDRRSAALVIADDLSIHDDSEHLQIIMKKITRTTQQVNMLPNGEAVNAPGSDPSIKVSYTFDVSGGDAPMDGMKRTVIESAVRFYQSTNNFEDGFYKVEYADAVAAPDGSMTQEKKELKLSDFYLTKLEKENPQVKGSIQVHTNTKDSAGVLTALGDPFNAVFQCNHNSKPYEYGVTFQYQPDPEAPAKDYSMLEVRMFPSVGVTSLPEVDQVVKKGTGYERTLTEVELTTVSWTDPVIRKNGV